MQSGVARRRACSSAGKSGWSCLHYFLDGQATVPPDLGVLLPTTWRLHPEICRFISDTAYEGRLEPDGNIQSSEEETDRIAEYVGEPRRSTVRHEDGTDQPFDIEKNLLIVAPYNAQVRLLKERLKDARIRIASVDKFQGQQASVVILSMCASSLEETARGPKFLLKPQPPERRAVTRAVLGDRGCVVEAGKGAAE